MRVLTLALPFPVRLSVRLFFALAVSALALAPGLLVDNSTRLASLAIHFVSPDADRYSYDQPAAATSRAIHNYDSRNSVGESRAHSDSAIAAKAAPAIVRGGETAATAYGRAIHKSYSYGPASKGSSRSRTGGARTR
jgi:hypothetical protein